MLEWYSECTRGDGPRAGHRGVHEGETTYQIKSAELLVLITLGVPQDHRLRLSQCSCLSVVIGWDHLPAHTKIRLVFIAELTSGPSPEAVSV